ncbi:hypothetical protein CBL_13133 [Carabus blaptoides fortunei]
MQSATTTQHSSSVDLNVKDTQGPCLLEHNQKHIYSLGNIKKHSDKRFNGIDTVALKRPLTGSVLSALPGSDNSDESVASGAMHNFASERDLMIRTDTYSEYSLVR